MTLQLQQGGSGARSIRERVHVEGTAEAGTGCSGHLSLGIGIHRALTEHSGHPTPAHRLDQTGHASGSDLALRIHRPEIGLLKPVVVGQIGEGTLTADQDALGGRNPRQGRPQVRIQLTQLALVGLAIGPKSRSPGGIEG